MLRFLRLLPAVALVSLVALGVLELLYRGWVGARQRWAGEPELVFELYTYGLPPRTGEEVSRLFCGKLENLPIYVRPHSDALELRNVLSYRLKKRPSAALLRLPRQSGGPPSVLEPLVRRSLLWSDLLRPGPRLESLRRRLILESRAAGALPILAGRAEAGLARELEVVEAVDESPAALARALAEQRGEKPRCQPAAGRIGR